MAISLTMLETAMAAPQPKVWNLMSASRSSVDLDIEGHHVAADGVADLADAVGVLDDAHVAGVLEMVHDLIGVDHDVFSSRNFV